MIAVGKGERGRNRSYYSVRKQGHGQLLAEWLYYYYYYYYYYYIGTDLTQMLVIMKCSPLLLKILSYKNAKQNKYRLEKAFARKG
jgi:hypothetical protein